MTKIIYNELNWLSYFNSFQLINEDLVLKNKNRDLDFCGEDLMQFENKKTRLVIDIGVYGENKYQYPFVGYTIMIISNHDWSNPIETILVPTSFQLKEVVEALLKKYENWEA